ncbi:MAG TPA: hypothetical protein DGD08_01880 [Gemmatimonas aurantiaca]|uniref:Uncharacterized protein n=2 Tax=Gemmatimonas aurantiaca TaxID=173480 RepID=C1AAQ6_GEMAT|nr:hypothetical protein [Gemmatimonas aurantiaca]BAH39312.1 hypothetical protein GAU_2270 [Gemmatimonas aurantiaca T-27]HCT55943.1 hypothetical protein [Gemmatimonas aurantiaca]
MGLSVSNVIAWDFTSASTPLASKIGQAATFSLLNGADITEANGIRLLTSGDRADLSCAAGGRLVGWTHPYTMVSVFICPRTGSAVSIPMGRRVTSAGANILGNGASGSSGAIHVVNSGTGINPTATAPNGTPVVLITEFRANGTAVWFGATSMWSNAVSYTMPALNTTDIIRFGPGDGNTAAMTAQGFALVPGVLSAADRTALAANWRTALFQPRRAATVYQLLAA